MKTLFLPLLTVAFGFQTCMAADFYVSGKPGIYRGAIDNATGTLGKLTLAVAEKHPGFLTLSPNGSSLYAGLARSVAAFSVQADGSLKKLNELESGGDDPCHVAVDRTGRYVFAANYENGTLACFSTNPDGSLAKRLSLTQFTGSGPDQSRQKTAHAHAVYLDAENKFLYACDLGSDRVWIFKFDATTGSLTPAESVAGKIPPGHGPRHLAFRPDGLRAYVLNEMGGSLTTFERDPKTGALTALETISALPSDKPQQNASLAELVCHPSGKWLYGSNRRDHTIAVFTLAADGRATLLENAPSEAKAVRSFAIDPDGHWLVAAGLSDNRLVVLKLDPSTGRVTPTDQTVPVDGPMCVLFVPKPDQPGKK
ncbi:MAG TPA: lactonase family protein [Chthoniobacterales bacterium]|nr:lactonase family protein [Chthoniobacterales bacterium]